MEVDAPKSSAVTISRRRRSADAIIRKQKLAAPDSVPHPQNQKKLLHFRQLCLTRFKNIESAAFDLAEQFPINGSHQFRCRHRASISSWESFLRFLVETFGKVRDMLCQLHIIFIVLAGQYIFRVHPKSLAFLQWQIQAVSPSI